MVYLLLIIGLGALFNQMELRLIWFYQNIGLIDKKYMFHGGDGFEYTYIESARIWILILMLLLIVGWNIWYYRKHKYFFWELFNQ